MSGHQEYVHPPTTSTSMASAANATDHVRRVWTGRDNEQVGWASSSVFPSMKARRLLAVLARPPLRYRVVRQAGSHRRLQSATGYPPLTVAWHDGATLVMEYHCEPEGWWARSADLPGFLAAGASFDEVRELAHSGAEFYLERPVEVEDRPPQFHGEANGSS